MAPFEITHFHSEMLYQAEPGLIHQLVRDGEILAVTLLWTGLGLMSGLLLALFIRVFLNLSLSTEVTLLTSVIGTVTGYKLEAESPFDSEILNHV